MPPPPIHRRQESNTTYSRPSILPGSNYNTTATHTFNTNPNTTYTPNYNSSASTPSMSAAKSRQYAHLHAQLAQLNANLADTENLLPYDRCGYSGALFMGSAKILGEEGVKGNADKDKKADSEDGGIKREESDED
ncbi:hypothetical protein N7519_010352 [Penicillium mononematosum]|uniref:uncharacterized protein n=1 Tax=Penicillium mononematosum TaxID=268346 RepID=UPI002548EF53|nr:uncharacterized protein N7519_010352 [Penicillium mononematosum]KAJ6179891.1 hypothetical protein N7519_010352 [Penicillium mononematosum]